MRLVVDSHDHCYVLDKQRLNALQSPANSTQLEPGTYVIRIEKGAFKNSSDSGQFLPEPWVMLWIHGGRVVNKKTNVAVGATWTSLNGYSDALILDVEETTTLCGLFLDTDTEHSGSVTLSIMNAQ